MQAQVKTGFLFYTFILLMCVSSFFVRDTAAQGIPQLVAATTTPNFTFETIDVPGVDFLAVTSSSDFEDYGGYTKRADDGKIVAFTIIDGVFMTYDFPGASETRFYALGNNGQAAGYYVDSEGKHRGVVLTTAGELQQYDFPGSVETEIFGISDSTGNLTGNFIDAEDGKRRGFTGTVTGIEIIEFPGAVETYADFINSHGGMVGSYVDADGVYYPYVRTPNGRFVSLALPEIAKLEYFFVHGINDAQAIVARTKAAGGVPLTYIGTFQSGLKPFKVPDSVSTEGYNINQDGSIVGHYDTTDGRRHGFIARPVSEAVSERFGNAYNVTLSKGLNMLSVPLASPTPMTAKSLVATTGATTVITLDAANQRFVAWTPSAPDDGFAIEGGKGYIVNVREARQFAFVGARWTNQADSAAAPAVSTQMPKGVWAFVVSGRIGKPTETPKQKLPYEGKSAFDGYTVSVRNLRTNKTITTSVVGDYFAAASADLSQRSVVKVGDVVEVRVIGSDGNIESQTRSFKVTPEHLANAVLSVNLDNIGQPMQSQLLQNYPNPFNPETWIPYQLSEDSTVSISIYDTTGQLVRTLLVGHQSAGFYNSQARAAYWDGRNALGERVASGVYFYQLITPEFQQTKRMLILK